MFDPTISVKIADLEQQIKDEREVDLNILQLLKEISEKLDKVLKNK